MPSPTSDSPSLPPSEDSTRPLEASDGADGPFPAPPLPEASGARTELPAPEPTVALCGFVHDQWDIVRMRRRCIAPAGHSRGLFAYDHGPWQSAPDAPSTPPAARVPAQNRPEVAGEPEAAAGGVAGRVAAPSGRALTMREIRVALGHRVDFDGCNSECRMALKHTLRWGGCEHAVEPEPTASMSVVYTDPSDGQPSIGFDRYTVAELAELIEPALRDVAIRLGPNALAMLRDGHEVRLSGGEIGRLALAAAHAIITHSNRDGS